MSEEFFAIAVQGPPDAPKMHRISLEILEPFASFHERVAVTLGLPSGTFTLHDAADPCRVAGEDCVWWINEAVVLVARNKS
jgi:hypothetical protein